MNRQIALYLGICLVVCSVPALAQSPAATTALYRWQDAQSGDYFYTTDPTGNLLRAMAIPLRA